MDWVCGMRERTVDGDPLLSLLTGGRDDVAITRDAEACGK